MPEIIKARIKAHKEEKKALKEYFDCCMDDIDSSNMFMLRRVCFYDFILYFALIALLKIADPTFRLNPGHYILLIILSVYFVAGIITWYHPKIRTIWVSVLCLAFYFWVAVGCICMDVFSEYDDACLWTTIILMSFPVLFIDRQFKYAIEETVTVIVYLALKWHINPDNFEKNAYSVITAAIFSFFISRIMLGLRSRKGLNLSELKQTSSFDKLTRVHTKAALLEKIDEYLGKKDPDEAYAMCVIDIDDFKKINDNLGHSEGDRVLEQVGKLLAACFRPEKDIMGRFGGDEFVVLMPGMDDENSARMRCNALRMMLTGFNIGNDKPFSISAGVVIDKGNHSREEIFEIADDALYSSKLQGKSRCTVWTIWDDNDQTEPVLVQIVTLGMDGDNILYKNEHSRFDIRIADTGEEAIRLISEYYRRVKLIVIETRENEKSSNYVLGYLRDREKFHDIPVLAVVENVEEARKILKYGKYDVLTSSDDPSIFREHIGKLTGIG